jgi:hypothetical protein
MNYQAYNRNLEAEKLVGILTDNLTSDVAKKAYGLHDTASANAFALGYISSLVVRLASISPASLKELKSQVEWNQERLEA